MGKRQRKSEGNRSHKKPSDRRRERDYARDTSWNPEGNREDQEHRSEWKQLRPGYRPGSHWYSEGEYAGLGNFGPSFSPGWSRTFPPDERRRDARAHDWRENFHDGFGNTGQLSESAYMSTHVHKPESRHWSAENGPHSGQGPRGYERADERMYEEVCERLTDHGGIDARHIEVRCEHGEVTLEGTVQDRYSKRLAEAIAESARGVRDVHNRLRVAGPDNGSPGAEPPAQAW